MGPYFGEVKGIEGESLSLFIRHELYTECPFGKITLCYGVEEVVSGAVWVFAIQGICFGITEAAYALLTHKMELAPHALSRSVDEGIGVTAKTVHVPKIAGNSPLAHGDGHLMKAFRQARPEIPLGGIAAAACLRVSVQGVVEIGELEWVTNEENGGVVAHQIPVAFVCVKFQGETADIAVGIGVSALSRSRGKAGKHRRDFADFAEKCCLCVWRNILGDGEFAVRTPAFGVHAAFGKNFSIQVCHFFKMPHILQQHRPAWTCCHAVGIVRYRCSGGRGEFMRVAHSGTSISLPNLFGKVLVLTVCGFSAEPADTDDHER